jgi:hypothetical protein
MSQPLDTALYPGGALSHPRGLSKNALSALGWLTDGVKAAGFQPSRCERNKRRFTPATDTNLNFLSTQW